MWNGMQQFWTAASKASNSWQTCNLGQSFWSRRLPGLPQKAQILQICIPARYHWSAPLQKNAQRQQVCAASYAQSCTSIALKVSPETLARSVPEGSQRFGKSKATEPLECSQHEYRNALSAGTAMQALAESNLRDETKRERAALVLRGLRQGPFYEQRVIAENYTEALSEGDVRSVLLDVASELHEADFFSEVALQGLASQAPILVDGVLDFFSVAEQEEQLRKVKPLMVLDVPRTCPATMHPLVHMFMLVLQYDRGPLYRSKTYQQVLVEEREHFPFVIEKMRHLAPEFFNQYCRHEEKLGQSTQRVLIQEADSFLLGVSERLFALAFAHCLPLLLQRQEVVDAMGSPEARQSFAQEFRWVPPPLTRLRDAFGIDVRSRVKVNPDWPLHQWQRTVLGRRKRTFQLTEALLPTVEQLGQMALATPLRHRPWVSFLAELHTDEEPHLRPWFAGALPHGRGEEVIPHVFWSRELLEALTVHLLQTVAGMQSVCGAEGHTSILCVGSGATRLRHYLDGVLNNQNVNNTGKIRVAAVLPSKKASESKSHKMTSVVPWPSPTSGSLRPAAAHTDISLPHALVLYKPAIVICSCMPPGVDWTRSFRTCSSLVEYVLIGAKDTARSGDAWRTWGQPPLFKKPHEAPMYIAEGFVRTDLEDVSALCVGTDDAPGLTGFYSAVSFRRRVQQSLPRSQHTMMLQQMAPAMQDSIEQPPFQLPGHS
eukprot:gnl/MRDRNA2_/MRDRNA2_32436_c0_seq1.p1 gnl/MRDRNA2_/MRDRNA2_32436_c0~~gnl/MRDRNA2_/MRDRNA2_32436_c0_seq1.p1  ORF type:complete len:715 (-),score=118.49 gnl/MRDRNA2_/MRDRNA2_32436_c0_seq1:34-2178(-)